MLTLPPESDEFWHVYSDNGAGCLTVLEDFGKKRSLVDQTCWGWNCLHSFSQFFYSLKILSRKGVTVCIRLHFWYLTHIWLCKHCWAPHQLILNSPNTIPWLFVFQRIQNRSLLPTKALSLKFCTLVVFFRTPHCHSDHAPFHLYPPHCSVLNFDPSWKYLPLTSFD